MDRCNFMVLVDEDGGGVGEEAIQLTADLFLVVIEAAAEQQRVGEAETVFVELEIFFCKSAIIADLERKAHDLEAVFSELLLQMLQHRRLVQTVVTPGAHDIDDQRFALKAIVSMADRFSRD